MNDIQNNILVNKKLKQQIKISDLNDFKNALRNEGYNINEADEEVFKESIARTFQIDSRVIEVLYSCIMDTEITYRAKDIKDFIDYVEKIISFENEHNKLCEKISEIRKLNIYRLEYERVASFQENVEHIVDAIEKMDINISYGISEHGKVKLEDLEREIDEEYLYAKDIELLKKILVIKEEKYNNKTKIKTISMEVPNIISCKYIKPNRGSVEYHQHLSNNIPRVQRLIKNIDRYIRAEEDEKVTFKINQSEALQDSINMAVAIFNKKEFRAISGSNEIKNCCIAPPIESATFKSSKVNKLGKLGIGYDRVNDSEKKIFEEIHRQIEEKILENEGSLILYSKWEPCPSCYFVISQFCKKHPNIKVEVKYSRKYGE